MSNQFSKSDEKYGLWVPQGCKVNKVLADGVDLIVMQLFVLNADSAKALEAANMVVSVAAKMPDNTSYELEAGKATGLKVRLSVTGAEVKARAAAIIQLHNSDRGYTVLAEGTKKSAVRKSSVSKVAGLIPQATMPVPVTKK